MERRNLIFGATALAALGTTAWWQLGRSSGAAQAAEGKFEIELTRLQWRNRLTEEQFDVLRDHGTERAYSSPLDRETREGIFACAGCDLPLYSSETKYDSGTGWPSFYEPLPDAIGTQPDFALFVQRTEVHCRRCGGHLGHVFDDGPPPTGKRYCMNGVAMVFHPKAA